jgi:hypothetical protein
VTPKDDEESTKVTDRVVLEREVVLILPAGGGTPPDKLLAAWKALGEKGVPQEAEAWVVVGEHAGATKSKAIRAHTGEPGTPTPSLATSRRRASGHGAAGSAWSPRRSRCSKPSLWRTS